MPKAKRELASPAVHVKRECPVEELTLQKHAKTLQAGCKPKADEPDVKEECKLPCKLEATHELLEDRKSNPFPGHAHPTEAECHKVHMALCHLHPEVLEQKKLKREASQGGCGDRSKVLDALVGTILSQNTTDVNSHRAFCSLKTRFPTWDSVLHAQPVDVEDAIRSGGLAATKTARVQSILQTLQAERGELSLEYVRQMPDDAVKSELRRFKGVGAKTISCVLMFCLMRPDFPVDTHVWKIALALGWVPKSADRDQTYEHLNGRVPADIKYALHVMLVEHGKVYKNDIKMLRQACAQQA